MKTIFLVVCFASLAIGFTAHNVFKSGIHGTVDPPEGAAKVWAISGTDSVSAIPVTGKFSMEVKPGNWSIVVEAVSPYKNVVVNNILVLESQSTDAGVIRLRE